MKLRALFPSLLVLAMAATLPVHAADKDLKAEAKIGKAEAKKTALARVPGGKIKSAELEEEDGKLIWSFDIAMKGTKGVTEVNVDAKTGELVAVEVESAEKETAEKANEKIEKKHGKKEKAEKDDDEKEEKK